MVCPGIEQCRYPLLDSIPDNYRVFFGIFSQGLLLQHHGCIPCFPHPVVKTGWILLKFAQIHFYHCIQSFWIFSYFFDFCSTHAFAACFHTPWCFLHCAIKTGWIPLKFPQICFYHCIASFVIFFIFFGILA